MGFEKRKIPHYVAWSWVTSSCFVKLWGKFWKVLSDYIQICVLQPWNINFSGTQSGNMCVWCVIYKQFWAGRRASGLQVSWSLSLNCDLICIFLLFVFCYPGPITRELKWHMGFSYHMMCCCSAKKIQTTHQQGDHNCVFEVSRDTRFCHDAIAG